MTSLLDLGQHEESAGHDDLIPPGVYPMAVFEQTVAFKEAEGKVGCNVQFVILDGPHANRRVFEYLNLQNPNAQCVAISAGKLKQMQIAVGRDPNAMVTEDLLAQLVTCQMMVTVKVKQSKNPAYPEPQNELSNFKPITAAPQQPAAPQYQTPAPAAPQQPAPPPYQAPAQPTTPAAPPPYQAPAPAPAGGNPTPPMPAFLQR